ncbi:YwqG family protein [Nannocystis sp. SCPEA4]|uniref:YwqG family protein n=1 Tax=Nannocystis sp. SCPEA4 TaxID=2996787 RepID=UPI00226F7B04|nr:YwqG family protein [Nannocystis sp. SCPEA4]
MQRLLSKLAPFQAQIERTLRPCARMVRSDAPPLPWRSQIGPAGHPYLPIDRDYPRSRTSQRPLLLLAQVNFAEVPALPGFPARGILQVFISDEFEVRGARRNLWGMNERDKTDQSDFRVIYHANVDTDPSNLYGPDDFDFLPAFAFAGGVGHCVGFAPGQEPVSDADASFAARYDPALVRLVLYDRAARAEYMRVFAEHGDKNQLGGYHYSSNGIDPRPLEWTRDGRSELLLQIDGCSEISFGDLGSANFFILRDDLKRRDFSRVLYHWDCT